jgi:hypothetical protein
MKLKSLFAAALVGQDELDYEISASGFTRCR